MDLLIFVLETSITQDEEEPAEKRAISDELHHWALETAFFRPNTFGGKCALEHMATCDTCQENLGRVVQEIPALEPRSVLIQQINNR